VGGFGVEAITGRLNFVVGAWNLEGVWGRGRPLSGIYEAAHQRNGGCDNLCPNQGLTTALQETDGCRWR
jgi:hypothetical protein